MTTKPMTQNEALRAIYRHPALPPELHDICREALVAAYDPLATERAAIQPAGDAVAETYEHTMSHGRGRPDDPPDTKMVCVRMLRNDVPAGVKLFAATPAAPVASAPAQEMVDPVTMPRAQYVADRNECFRLGVLEGRDSPAPAQLDGDAERADAERYRWLRTKRDISDTGIPWAVYLDPKERVPTSVLCCGADLDAAIDAALATQQGDKHE